jgi:vancomycin aglycone glucosyltransferase
LPRWANSALWSFSDNVIFGLMKIPLNAERAKLGLAPIRSTPKHLFEGLPYLLACDEAVAPRPPDWSRYDVTTTGPWFYDDPAPLDPEVEAFLDSGSAPVYVGFGSMVSSDAVALTRTVLDGAGARGRRVLMSKGWAGIGSAELPDSVMVVHGPMPHAKLFPRVAAVVHHGGAGTTASALRAGVPQVIVPHLADQFHHAHRLAVLGIAPPGIRIARLTAERLGQAIDAALATPAEPRSAAAARLRNADGLARAVAAIERLAPTNSRVKEPSRAKATA